MCVCVCVCACVCVYACVRVCVCVVYYFYNYLTVGCPIKYNNSKFIIVMYIVIYLLTKGSLSTWLINHNKIPQMFI